MLRQNSVHPFGEQEHDLEIEKHKEAWSVYLQNQEVFAAVLNATGPWQLDEGIDLIHDFLIDRLPQALTTFDPKRGPIRPWLSTVFIRYAKRRLLEKASVRQRWINLETVEDPNAETRSDDSLTIDQRRRIQDAIETLPDEFRLSLRTYFGSGPEAGNLRALARKFHWSRHRSRQTVLRALAALAAQLGEHGILTHEELEVCHSRLIRGEKWEYVTVRLKKTEHQVRSLLNSALVKLNASVSKS